MAPGGVARPAAAWWLGILSGLVLCGAAAYGPALLPPGLAWARVLGVRLFGSVSGIRVVFWLAQVVRIERTFRLRLVRDSSLSGTRV